MIFSVERDPHEALGGGGEQQRTERAVDGPVRHVEHSGPLGFRDEPGAQAVGGGRVEPEGGCSQVVDDLVRCS